MRLQDPREEDEVDVRIDCFSRSVLQLELTNDTTPQLPAVYSFVAAPTAANA